MFQRNFFISPSWESNAPDAVLGPASSLVNQVALFADTSGKLLKASDILKEIDLSNFFAASSAGNYTLTGDYNTGISNGALANVTLGSRNVAISRNALGSLTEANDCIGIGYEAGLTAGGDHNINIGTEAGRNLLSGENNLNIGSLAGHEGGNSSNNVNLGFQAQRLNASGSSTVAVGVQCFYNNQINNQTGLGYKAGYSNTSGVQLTLLGFESGLAIDDANSVTAAGYQSLHSLVTADDVSGFGSEVLKACLASGNSGFGAKAGLAQTTGLNGTFLGAYAGQMNTVSDNVTAAGYRALERIAGSGSGDNTSCGALTFQNLESGPRNSAFGTRAGKGSFTALTDCLFLGADATASGSGLTNAISIGVDSVVSTSNSMVLGKNGTNVGIGTSSPEKPLHVVGGILHDSSSKRRRTYLQSGGSTTDNSPTTFITQAVAEGQIITIEGLCNGHSHDMTKAIAATFFVSAFRQTGEETALVSDPVITIVHSSLATLATITADVDEVNNTIRIRAIGLDSEQWDWDFAYSAFLSSV
jgi:hypothetical protein